ncbi:MAG TPA: hypothetical protein VLQ65_10095 [Saliniramus sp.]|nr:hypothetical protein [Saliniramus sp.]
MQTKHGPLIAMPYNLDVNDSIIYAIERHASGQMLDRVERTLRVFERECEKNPRVFAIGLHPHLIGVPHRFAELERMIDILSASPEVVFATGSQIAEWYANAEPAQGAA